MEAAADLTGGGRQGGTPPADFRESERQEGTGLAQMPMRRLDFDVVIATRNRPAALALSIPLILGQSRLPRKLIVIDSSDDHAPIAKTVAEAVAKAKGGWAGSVIVEHTGPGSAYQRNRGLAHVESEVVIFPDDDSLLHPGTSEAIMRAYELDTQGRIAGVCAADAREPPPGVLAGAQYEMPSAAKRQAVRRRKRLGLNFKWVQPQLYFGNLLKARFEPLDWFEDENCVLVEEMWGYRMSFRTSVVRANPFDEVLRAYALHEDLDASFSAMRQGCLVGARNARIYHHKFPTGRGDPYNLGMMRLLNLSYVVLKHVHDAALAPAEAKELRRLFRQNCWLMILRALRRSYRRSDREEARGMLAALEGVRAMLGAPRGDLARIYSESFARRARRAHGGSIPEPPA
jgi:glycosyltransferase involved in cell wall biosynthesis